MIADRELDLHAAKLLILDAAARKDRREPFAKEASMAKLFASEAAHRATDTAIQLHGGAGYIRDYPWSAMHAMPASPASTRAPRKSSA